MLERLQSVCGRICGGCTSSRTSKDKERQRLFHGRKDDYRNWTRAELRPNLTITLTLTSTSDLCSNSQDTVMLEQSARCSPKLALTSIRASCRQILLSHDRNISPSYQNYFTKIRLKNGAPNHSKSRHKNRQRRCFQS